jgi:hypothetical protein
MLICRRSLHVQLELSSVCVKKYSLMQILLKREMFYIFKHLAVCVCHLSGREKSFSKIFQFQKDENERRKREFFILRNEREKCLTRVISHKIMNEQEMMMMMCLKLIYRHCTQ